MHRIAIVTLGLVLAAGAFFGGVQWSARRGAAPDAGTAAALAAEAGSTAAQPAIADAASPGTATQSAGTAAATVAAAIAWPPLPATDAPVADSFDELADRARRGDSAAACRLGVDLQRCAGSLGRRELAENLQNEAARYEAAPPERMVNFIASVEQEQERTGQRCDGLQDAQLAQAYDFQRRAAQARPELRTWFALDPALDRRDFVNELERWADYRRVAMPMLEAAARDGDLGALIALARVHGDLRRNSPPFPPFRLADDVRTVAYSDLLQRYGVEFSGIEIGAAQARARLDAEGLARAAQFADSLHRADLPRADDATASAAMQRTFNPQPKSEDCAEPAAVR